MLAKRIIPCLDVKDGQTVKGTNFVNLRQAGDPVELGKFYSELYELRQTGDYDDWKVVTENDVKPLLPTAELFLNTLENLIKEDGYLN